MIDRDCGNDCGNELKSAVVTTGGGDYFANHRCKVLCRGMNVSFR